MEIKRFLRNNKGYFPFVKEIARIYPEKNVSQVWNLISSCPECGTKLNFAPGENDLYFCSNCFLSFGSTSNLIASQPQTETKHASAS